MRQLPPETGDEAGHLAETGVWLAPMRRLVRSRAKGALGARERAALEATVAGRPWTTQTLHRMGYEVDGSCPFCGQADTVFHRVWVCPEYAEQRAEYVDSKLVEEALAAGESHPGFAHGWFADPARRVRSRRPEEEHFRYKGPAASEQGALFKEGRGPIFSDGSALNSAWRSIASAA